MEEMRSLATDWHGLLLNPRWLRTDYEVTWQQRSGLRLPARLTHEALAEAGREGQYSFQMIDGSLLQLWYRFAGDRTTLQSAGLGYYRNEAPGEHFDDDELEEDDADPDDVGPADVPVIETLPWIRFDYDPGAFRGCVHAKCHMHWSMCNGSRLAVRGVPSPRQFVESVMSWFYSEEYAARHLNDDGSHRDDERVGWVNGALLVDEGDDPHRARLMHVNVIGG
jgi:hypothetical protein